MGGDAFGSNNDIMWKLGQVMKEDVQKKQLEQ